MAGLTPAVTIGRIVHFEDGVFGTCAAIVTNVKENSDTGKVCLALFHKDRPAELHTPPVIYHYADFSETPKVGCWNWPPKV